MSDVSREIRAFGIRSTNLAMYLMFGMRETLFLAYNFRHLFTSVSCLRYLNKNVTIFEKGEAIILKVSAYETKI